MITYFDTAVVLSLDVANALIAFASKDVTRPHIGVGVDQGSLCATDGHRAVAFEPCEDAEWCRNTQGKVWPRAHVETQVKLARAVKAKEVRLELEHAKGGFPEVWRVVPDYGMEPTGAAVGVGVDPAYLADLGKVAKACGVNGVKLTQLKGDRDPIGFTAASKAGHTARVVIMPMRL